MVSVTGISKLYGGNGHDPCAAATAAAVNLTLPSAEEIKGLNIHQRIRWITAEARSLPKAQWNPDGEFAYTGHDQIIDMLRLLLAKYGVNIYQEALEYKREATMGGFDHLTTVKYEYEVINADSPEDNFARHNWGEAIDHGDKGLNKCSTIAEKMFLLRLFKLATFDDPDANSAERSRNRTTHQNGERSRREHVPSTSQNECQKCHELITAARREGKTWQSSEAIAVSRKQFGKRLCVDCLLEAQAASNSTSVVKAGTPDSGQAATPSARKPEAETAAAADSTGPAKTSPTFKANGKAGS